MREWQKKLDDQLQILGIRPHEHSFGENPKNIQFATADINLDNAEDWKSIRVDEKTGALINDYGRTIVVYIKDNTFKFINYPLDSVDLKKVHLTWCRTLQSMEKKGRYDRYVGTQSKTNKYTIEVATGSGSTEEIENYLRPCKNCLKQVKFKGRESFSSHFLKNFHIREWFEYCDKHNVIPPKKTRHTPTTYPGSEYTKEYEEIAKKLKKQCKYTCQHCSKNYAQNKSKLDCHHINGVKGDNRPENLQILCVNCHKKQTNHGHYKR